MTKSNLQSELVKQLIENIEYSRESIKVQVLKGNSGVIDNDEVDAALLLVKEKLGTDIEALDTIIWDTLQQSLHSFLVTLDGGSALAEKGVVTLVDDSGNKLDSNLHEVMYDYLEE